MKKVVKILIAIMLLLALVTPVFAYASEGDPAVPEIPAVVEEGPLNSFWEALRDFIQSPSWGSFSAVLLAILTIVAPFVWFWLKGKLAVKVEKLKAKLEIAKTESGNYKKLYQAYKQEMAVNRDKINALFDSFASMIDAMNLRVDYKDKITKTLEEAKKLTVQPIELEPVPDNIPEELFEPEEIPAEETTEIKIGW